MPSEAYQALLVEREQLLMQRSKRLEKKAFKDLKEKHQLEYCGLNKKLMENYWRGFETAEKDKTYKLAAQDFQKAFEMGISKAKALFLKQSIDATVVQKYKKTPFQIPDEDFITGLRFHLGLGYSQNPKAGIRIYRQAAKQNHPSAKFNLGYCYHHGIGVGKDEKEAVRWYRLAAEQGHNRAQNSLGFCYQYGIGVDKDGKEAVRWYQVAADQGHNLAQNDLGYCYRHSIGVDKDEKEAVRLYRSAAEQGNVSAQSNLGYCYHHGIGVNKDEKEAVRWYRLAAEQGDTIALQHLKTLTTPLACFTVAFLEKDHTKTIELALSHEELEIIFFTEEFAGLAEQLEDRKSVSSFFQTLQEQAQRLNKNINASLITALLSLDSAISTCSIIDSEEIAFLMTGIIDIVSFADAQASQVKALMHFFCNLYDDNKPEAILKPLVTLWHRAQALDVVMDDPGLNQLLAARIVSCLFENKFCFQPDHGFHKDDLIVLVCAYEKTVPFTAEQLNKTLSRPLLVESKYHPKNFLPRLKACIKTPETWDKGIPITLARHVDDMIKEDKPLNENTACQLMSKLRKYAKTIRKASELPGLFSQFQKKEIELARLIESGKEAELIEWIEKHEVSFTQNEKGNSSAL